MQIYRTINSYVHEQAHGIHACTHSPFWNQMLVLLQEGLFSVQVLNKLHLRCIAPVDLLSHVQ